MQAYLFIKNISDRCSESARLWKILGVNHLKDEIKNYYESQSSINIKNKKKTTSNILEVIKLFSRHTTEAQSNKTN